MYLVMCHWAAVESQQSQIKKSSAAAASLPEKEAKKKKAFALVLYRELKSLVCEGRVPTSSVDVIRVIKA